jgi:predicted nucleic acid-binding Zn ribbon protein
MARWRETDEDWDDDDADDEDADEPEDYDSDEGPDTVPCPHCKKPIPEDTPRCPYCENYLSDEDASQPRVKPLWIVVGVVVCLVLVYFWIVPPR